MKTIAPDNKNIADVYKRQAIACMMFAGNYVFIHYLGEDGVAAFSIACYFFPIIFMVYNARGQSAQPILSDNFGAGDADVYKRQESVRCGDGSSFVPPKWFVLLSLSGVGLIAIGHYGRCV